jgi:hypothetical protein
MTDARCSTPRVRATHGEPSGASDFDSSRYGYLGGQGKTGHSSTLQNRPFPVSGIEASEFYRTLSPDCKSVWTFVRQLRGPHFSTCA